MARGKINKAEKIRETLEKLGADARTKDVIATLKAQKITVAAAQVSNIKAALRGPKKAKRGHNGHGDLISLAGLQAAKKLVESLGSVEAAQKALGVFAKLQ